MNWPSGQEKAAWAVKKFRVPAGTFLYPGGDRVPLDAKSYCGSAISLTMTAFCACRRFSASSNSSSACASKTSSVIS